MSNDNQSIAFAPLGTLANFIKGKKPPILKEKPATGMVPYIDIEAFEKGVFRRYTDPVKTALCEDGDVLMVWDGSRSGLVGHGRHGALGSTLAKIDVPFVEKPYLFYFLESLYPIINSRAKGVGIPHVDPNLLWSSLFPVVSANQQERVVAKIEELITELESGVKDLEVAQVELKHYRASVLAAACSGTLVPTEAGLAQTKGRTYENATDLLERIRKDRREKWSGRGKYKEPATPDISDLPALSEGWAWATIAGLAAPDSNSITDGPFGSNLKTEHYKSEGPRVIRLQNIGGGIFIDVMAHIKQSHFEKLQKHRIFAGDLVIAAFGDNPPRSCVIPESVGPAIVKADCIRFKPHQEISASYMNTVLNSEPVRARAKHMVHGVGRPRLNLGEIKSIPLPIPPLSEQKRIVAEVERRLSVADELESVLSANLQRAERLRQSILQQAFSGKLVSQDPDDEPASVLLGRITTGRASAVSQKKTITKTRARSKMKVK